MIGQKLTAQILQTNCNETDPRAGGGRCFGDSARQAIIDGFLVGDASYAFTNNCYLGGYQRVDIPIVRNWVLDCRAELVALRSHSIVARRPPGHREPAPHREPAV